jgi:1-acyl-sn-glycerol-3-phosphate acyltransferase
MLKPIAINRSAGRKAINQLIGQGRQRLGEGLSVIIFPEGTRTRPGAEPHYHVGGALLASKTGYPVIPIAHNAGCYWPKRTLLKYPGTIRVVIGKPINTHGMKTAEIMDAVQEWIESTVNTLGCRDQA